MSDKKELRECTTCGNKTIEKAGTWFQPCEVCGEITWICKELPLKEDVYYE